jgi:hypothetical protein
MGDLTDYEINLRLAEIANTRVSRCVMEPEGRSILMRMEDAYPVVPLEEWSPLTDWSQLGPLMERERASAETIWSHCRQWRSEVRMGPGKVPVRADDRDLKRAICLAIIAAHQPDAGEEGPTAVDVFAEARSAIEMASEAKSSEGV